MTGTIRSLCSGYGGLDLAVQTVTGAVVVDHAESNVDAARVLDDHWPGLKNLGDITVIDWSVLEPTDIICAGFPCQPVSRAGRRKANDDKQWLWPYIGDAVRLLRPRLVVLENVSGLLVPWRDGRWWRPAPVEQVLGDLAALGYDTSWRSVRASDVGAPHRRERVFIVATDAVLAGTGRDGRGLPRPAAQGGRSGVDLHAVTDARADLWGPYGPAIERWERLTRAVPPPRDDRGRLSPRFVEWMMGLPDGWVTGVGLTRTAELCMLGNGVVPQQAAYALTSILDRMGAAA